MVVLALATKPREKIILHLQQFGVAVGVNLLLTDIADNAGAAVTEFSVEGLSKRRIKIDLVQVFSFRRWVFQTDLARQTRRRYAFRGRKKSGERRH